MTKRGRSIPSNQAAHDADMVRWLSKQKAETIAEVLAIMRGLERRLAHQDGIRYFNRIYFAVTQAIERDIEAGHWQDPHWMECLDVEFAHLYFHALVAWFTDRSTCPPAWRPLFEKRFNEGIVPVQFVIAGINAHINRDLPIAIVRAFQGVNRHLGADSKERADYTRVNIVLDRVEREAITRLATDWVKTVCDWGSFAPSLLMGSISAMRKGAWFNAKRYWKSLHQGRAATERFVARLDRMTEHVGNILLVRTKW